MPDDPTPQTHKPSVDPTPQASAPAPAAPEQSSGAATPPQSAPPPASKGDAVSQGFKETLIGVTIAFVLAFVFRGYVIEAFQIPTGSMAPTLLGAHMRFQDPMNAYDWTVGPWDYGPGREPLSVQGARVLQDRGIQDANNRYVESIKVQNPISRTALGRTRTDGQAEGIYDVPLDAGDRIFVLKQLYPHLPSWLGGPQRWDCIVFRDPTDPKTNFIKRLIALPGEQVALVDGDVFVRASGGSAEAAPWDAQGWTIARKTERVQRAVWQHVYDSSFAPADPSQAPTVAWAQPWDASSAWDLTGRAFTFDGSEAATALDWDESRRVINDWYAYNQNPAGFLSDKFPVSDVALSFGIEPEQDLAGSIAATIQTRGRTFEIRFTTDRVTLTESGSPVADASLSGAFASGRITEVEAWHADQQIWVFINGTNVLTHAYEQTPADRFAAATARTVESVVAAEAARSDFNLFDNPDLYQETAVRWDFENTGAFTLHRVKLDRDLFYQPGTYGSRNGRTSHSRDREPFAATHPVENTLVLGPDHFFGLGDNSPQSSDGRAWDAPHPWIRETVDPTTAVIHRDLLIGKAFFVYFPAPHRVAGRPFLPDFGSLRWIW